MADWRILPYERSLIRDGFDSGEPLLDAWIKERATQWEKKGLARAFVAIRGQTRQILGYYTLSNSLLPVDVLPDVDRKGLPATVGVPAILIGRLAVDRSAQGEGLGRLLLANALARAETISVQSGAAAVEVHALHAKARTFYERYDFRALIDHPNHLFLSMKRVRRLGLNRE